MTSPAHDSWPAGTQSTPAGPERRQRGVRLSDLDKSRAFVIAFTGRRWETLGPLDELVDQGAAQLRAPAGASDEVARTDEHAAAPPSAISSSTAAP